MPDAPFLSVRREVPPSVLSVRREVPPSLERSLRDDGDDDDVGFEVPGRVRKAGSLGLMR